MLSVVGLCKTFRSARTHGPSVVALDDVDLEVDASAFATVLGPSGSGKTTLLRCIAGFETPDSGLITLAGRRLVGPDTPSVRPHGRGIGIVPQDGALFPHLTVAQNIAFGLIRRSRAQKRDRVGALLELVELSGLGDRRPHQLSGGQQQRVALARALAPEPQLILLDEPFSALDAKLRVELREEVREVLHELDTSAVLVTHDQAEAMTMADHLVVMREGRIVAAGDPRDVYDRPPDLETGRFLGDVTVLDGTVTRNGSEVSVDCELGRLPVAMWHGQNGRCQVLVRPEYLSIGPLDVSDAASAVTATVTRLSYHGAAALLHVTLAHSGTDLTVQIAGHDHYGTGDLVKVVVTRPVCTYGLHDLGH